MNFDKLAALNNLIAADLTGADFKFSLFVSAAESFKYDSVLKPFPPAFQRGGEKDINRLLSVIKKTPPLAQFLENPRNYPAEVIDLLHWVLVEQPEPRIRTVGAKEYSTVLAKAPQSSSGKTPTHIFEIIYASSAAESRFTDFARTFPTLHAFHGSKLFNFYNIISHGLQQHLNKTSVFGEGLYLSTELQVSLLYSPNGLGWRNSAIGPCLSCTALTEYIDHPIYSRHCAKESARGSNIPEKYVIVTNNDVVRVRFLIVYSSQTPRLIHKRPSGGLAALVFNQKFLAFVYVGLLLLIGFGNSRYLSYVRDVCWQRVWQYWTSLKAVVLRK